MSVLEFPNSQVVASASPGRTVRPVQIRALLDVIPCPTAIFDTSSRLLHTNARLKLLLQHEPQPQRLLQSLGELGRATALLRAERHQDITTSGSSYRARATFLDMQLMGSGETVVMSIEPLPDVLPGETQLQLRFGLTAQEARVSLLLARRESTVEIAEQLAISKNTVRRHIERVLAKLDISTRCAVYDRIRKVGPQAL